MFRGLQVSETYDLSEKCWSGFCMEPHGHLNQITYETEKLLKVLRIVLQDCKKDIGTS